MCSFSSIPNSFKYRFQIAVVVERKTNVTKKFYKKKEIIERNLYLSAQETICNEFPSLSYKKKKYQNKR